MTLPKSQHTIPLEGAPMSHKEIEVKFQLSSDEYHKVLEELKKTLSTCNLIQNDFVCKLKSGENFRMRCQPSPY